MEKEINGYDWLRVKDNWGTHGYSSTSFLKFDKHEVRERKLLLISLVLFISCQLVSKGRRRSEDFLHKANNEERQ